MSSFTRWIISGVALFVIIVGAFAFGRHSTPSTSNTLTPSLPIAPSNGSGGTVSTPSPTPKKPSYPSTPKASASSSALAFALTNSSDSKLSTLVSASGIDGLALQESWSRLEPSYGTYDWSKLDAALSLAKQKGKLVTLHLLASPHTPSWLAGRGAQYFSGTDIRGGTITDVVPWDSVYLSEYTKFLNALSSHLSSAGFTSTVFDVSDVVPVAEMNLVACRDGSLPGGITYDRSKYVAAWEQIGNALAAAFPSAHVFVSPPVHDMICMPAQDSTLYPEIMNYFTSKYGHMFWMFAADLTANGSDRAENHIDLVSQSGLGFQTIWSATNDPNHRMLGTYPSNLLSAVCKGEKDGGTYFEIYEVDVLNSDATIQKAISAVHDSSLCQ